jgi:hypothetical protein
MCDISNIFGWKEVSRIIAVVRHFMMPQLISFILLTIAACGQT